MSVVFEECNAPSISKVTDILSVKVFKLQYMNAVCGEYSAPLLKDYPCRLKKKPEYAHCCLYKRLHAVFTITLPINYK